MCVCVLQGDGDGRWRWPMELVWVGLGWVRLGFARAGYLFWPRCVSRGTGTVWFGGGVLGIWSNGGTNAVEMGE